MPHDFQTNQSIKIHSGITIQPLKCPDIYDNMDKPEGHVKYAAYRKTAHDLTCTQNPKKSE